VGGHEKEIVELSGHSTVSRDSDLNIVHHIIKPIVETESGFDFIEEMKRTKSRDGAA
jgi:hypothetical protein